MPDPFDAFFSYATSDWQNPNRRMKVVDRSLDKADQQSLDLFLQQEIQSRIGKSDFSIFRDSRSIPFGRPWKDQIIQAIAGCYLGIFLLSPNFCRSYFCRFEYELFKRRLEQDSSLIGVFIEWETREGVLFPDPVHAEFSQLLNIPQNIKLSPKITIPAHENQGKWNLEFYNICGQISNRINQQLNAKRLTRISIADILSTKAAGFVAIEPQTFPFGSPGDEPGRSEDDLPRMNAPVRHPFAIAKLPVTFAEYDGFCESTGRDRPNDQGWGRGYRPVVDVSWADANAYCEWLSDEVADGRRFRLPREIEWECACRAGTATAYAFGETITPDQANFDYSVGASTPVGEDPANAWGLFDMHGNVEEWTATPYRPPRAPPRLDAQEPQSDLWIIRGGSFLSLASELRSAFRNKADRQKGRYNIGFRVAFDL